MPSKVIFNEITCNCGVCYGSCRCVCPIPALLALISAHGSTSNFARVLVSVHRYLPPYAIINLAGNLLSYFPLSFFICLRIIYLPFLRLHFENHGREHLQRSRVLHSYTTTARYDRDTVSLKFVCRLMMM